MINKENDIIKQFKTLNYISIRLLNEDKAKDEKKVIHERTDY